MSVVVNLTSKDKKVESQSIGKEKNDPNPIDITRSDNNVGCKPNIMLSKVVLQSLDSTSIEEWLGASYRQSALIPTCNALDLRSCTVIIHAGYMIEIKVSR